MTPVEAKFELDKKLVALAAENDGRVPLISQLGFFLYPSADRRTVLCTAKRTDGAQTWGSISNCRRQPSTTSWTRMQSKGYF